MEQVFINLFTNAIQAMRKGGKLEVSTHVKKLISLGSGIGRRREDRFSLGDSVIVIKIEDTGTGIPEDTLQKIFDLFFITRQTKEHVGMGLSVVANIIEMHKGMIKIENKKDGHGTIATIMLKI